MQIEKKLNEEISSLTTEIHNKYPELIKYLDELQITVPVNEAFTIESLREYKNTLKEIIKKYKKDHPHEETH